METKGTKCIVPIKTSRPALLKPEVLLVDYETPGSQSNKASTYDQALQQERQLYRYECWWVTKGYMRKVDIFHKSCLRKIWKIYWPNKFTNEELIRGQTVCLSKWRTAGCDGLVMFLGCLWTDYPSLPWDVLQLGRGKEASQKPPGGEQWWKSWRRWDLLGWKRRPKGEAQAKAKDRVEWRRLIAALCPNRNGEIESVSSGGFRGGVGGPPLYFQTKLKPEGPKKKFLETGSPPLSQGRDDRHPSLSEAGECVSKPFPNDDRLIQVRL